MKIRSFKLIAVLLSAFIPVTAQADYKIATVEINRVLNEAKEAVGKRKDLDDLTSKTRKKVEERRSALQASEKKLREAGVKEDSKEAEKFRIDARNFSLFVKDSEEELKREFLKINKGLTEKAMKLVRDYAKNNDFDLVIDRSEGGRGLVLYGGGNLDITDAIIKEMNS